jgi:hypothetical protein
MQLSSVQATYPSLKEVETKYLQVVCRRYYDGGSPLAHFSLLIFSSPLRRFLKPSMDMTLIKEKVNVKVVYGGYPGLIVSRLEDPNDLWTTAIVDRNCTPENLYMYVRSTNPREIQIFMACQRDPRDPFQFIEIIGLNEHDQQGSIEDMLALSDGRSQLPLSTVLESTILIMLSGY